MSVMDAGELALFAASVRGAVTSGDDVDAALGDLGWSEALAVEPEAAVSSLFEAQGSVLATSSSLSLVLSSALGREDGAVVLPSLDSVVAPGSLTGDSVTVSGVALGPLPESVVVALADAVAIVDTGALTVEGVHGIDPNAGLVRVSGTVASQAESADGSWDEAVRLAHLALAHELLGASLAMLELARAHALNRVQFGVPISSFQAVRHRLADAYLAIEMAASQIEGAWLDGTPMAATMAKAQAGRAGRTTAKHCQQVLAGIGFTTEHDHHLYVRRVLLLDQLFGSTRTLTRALGERIIADRRVPDLLPL